MMKKVKIMVCLLSGFFFCNNCIAFADTGRFCYAKKVWHALAYADSIGLDQHIYSSQYSLAIKGGDIDSSEAFQRLVYTILYDAAYGKDPGFRYNGLQTVIDSNRISQAANMIISGNDWRTISKTVEPNYTLYQSLKAALLRYIDLEYKERSHIRKDIATRLRVYGMAPEMNIDDTSSAIKRFQTLVDLDTTGVADAATIPELSVPISARVRSLKQSLNYLRWINRLPDDRIILVNIPAARLQVINRNANKEINMKVILGKVTWQTPAFATYMDGITTYPYWIVPKSIAVKEILPKVRYNPGVLNANNIQVLDRYGRIISPGKIAWRRLSASYFPYTLRQSTGCDNSLGVIMFNINSPFSIFLHDTDAKELFNNRQRFLSHGCIRVENAIALAEAITDNEVGPTMVDELNSCLKDQTPKEIRLSHKVPVVIIYMLAGVDEHNELHFYQDIYGKEK